MSRRNDPSLSGMTTEHAGRRMRVWQSAWLTDKSRALPGPYQDGHCLSWQALCTCGCIQAKHAGPDNRGRCSACAACGRPSGRYRPDVIDETVRRATEGLRASFPTERRTWRRATKPYVPSVRESGQYSVRPSDIDGCGRAIWYRNFKPEAGTDFVEDGEAARGDMIEDYWVAVHEHLYPWREHQRKVTVPGLDGVYRIDEWDPITRRLIDCKSAGTSTWEFAQRGAPRRSALGQVLLYGLGMTAEGNPPESIQVTYINAETLRELPFVYRWDDPKVQRWAQEAHDEVLGRLTELQIAEATGEALERDRSGPSSDPICRRCPFRSDCWNLDRANALGRSGESVTVLGEEPDDPKIAWAIEQVVEANRLKREAEKHAEATKPLIEGLPVGVYRGERGPDDLWQIDGGRAPSTNWKEYHRLTVEAWAAGADGPEDVPVPVGNRAQPTAKRASESKRKAARKAADVQPACAAARQGRAEEGAA